MNSEEGPKDQPISVEVEVCEEVTSGGNEDTTRELVDGRQAAAGGGVVEGGASPSAAIEPSIVKGLKLRIGKKIVHVFSYALFPGIKYSTPVDWKLLETEDIEGENIRCHQLQGNELLTELFERYRNSDSKAVVLINTSDDYQLASDLISGVEKPCLPVIVLSKIDGDTVLQCLDDASQISEDVYAKIEVETDVDGGGGGVVRQGLQQQYLSPQTTPKKQPPPESSLTLGQKVKAKLGFQSKPVADLKADIKKLMFTSSDKTPLVVVEDQGRFTMIMAALHNYEKVAKRDSNHSDLNDVIKKLRTHMDALFTVDLPFYIFLIYRMHKKHIYYMCDEMRAMIMAVINRMESEDRRAVVQAMTAFMERGDFKIMYNPDKIEDRQVMMFHQLELACLELADLSYKIQISDVGNVGELPNGMKPIYKTFVYSRMLWISLGMKIRERRTGQATRKVLEVWVTKFVSYHQRVELTSEAIKELEMGLEVGQLLKLSPIFAFSQAQLTDFIAMNNDRTLRPFAQIMECFKRLKKFLTPPNEVVVMLSSLRSVYGDYLAAPVLPFKMKSVSCEGTLNGCITEGIEFLDMVLEWLEELDVSKEVKDAELESWLRLLLRLVDITGDNPAQYLKYFIKGREKIIKKYKLVAQNHTVTATQNSFGRLSIQQFCMLYKSFKIYSNNIVKEFLGKYSIPDTITLSDPTWKEFFGAIVVRSQSAHSHQYLAEFMIHCSTKYRESGRAVAFVTDLLKLDVEKLLSVSSEEDRESQEVRAKFSLFLKDFINRNALIHGILDHIVVILMSMTNKQNEFQRLVLDVLRREVVPDLRTLHGKGQKNNFNNLMKEIVRVLKNDLSWLSSLSTKQHFCWGILGTCVSKIAVNKDSFDWVHNYSDVVSGFELGVVYSCFCIDKKLSTEERVIIEGLPAAVKTHPSDDLRRYFEWIGAVQYVLQHWKKKFQHHDVTYDEVINYASSHVRFLPLGESVGSPHLVVESALIESAKTTFLEKFELLNAHLLKYIPGHSEGKWCMLPSLLETYGVVLPQAAQDFIVKKVAFPGEALIYHEQLGTPLHPNTTGLFKPGLEISLRLHKTVTLRELSKVLRDLETFQQPLLDHLQMLVFFKLHKSSLFGKYLRHFLKKIAEELQEPQEFMSRISFQDIPFSIPFATSPGSFVLPPSLARNNSQTKPRDNLVRGLVSTHILLKKIMFGTATYSEIVAEDEGMLKGLDIEQEFAILHEYGQYNHLTGAKCEGLDGVRNMLELFQYTTHVNNIRSVCGQYKLKGCLDDPKLKDLCVIMEDHVLSEDRSQLTPLEAKKKMTQVKQILCLGDHTSSKCLEIFAAMADSAAFYQFVRDKQFYGQQGQAIFRQQYELITAQLQHEEYDESVLNHLLVAFKIITPFMDSNKNLTELMQEVTALNATHGFKQLNTVNSNITLIRLWFSRAEGDTLENVAKELKCIMETGSYTFHLGVDPGVESGEDHGGTVKGELYLEYEPFYAASESEAVNGSRGGQSDTARPQPRVHKERKERKNAEQINDFLRKIGFVDSEKEGGEFIKQFLHLSQTAYKLLELFQKLKDLGHPLYLATDSVATIPCSTAKSEVEAQVQLSQMLLGAWTQEVADLRTRCHWLLYLNMPKLLQLYHLLHLQGAAGPTRVDNIVHEVSFLAPNTEMERKKLRARVEVAMKRTCPADSQESPMLVVGQFLDDLLQNHALPQHSPMSVRETISFPRHRAAAKISNQPLFFCPSYSHASRLCFILEIFARIPEAYQVLRCQATTSEEELELFLKRAQTETNHYLVLYVNKLPFKLQEQLVQLHLAMQSEDHMMLDMSVQPLCSSTISFVETSPSMLREMPWISCKETKEPRVTLEDAKRMCKPAASNLACAQLVYGAAGDGKSHYIKKQLALCPSYKTIAINEAFTPNKAISKLRSLPLYQRNVGIFFNFTILPPGDSVADVERERYRELMDVIAWFFFDLLVLGYVEDPDTGLSFRIPGGLEWAVYIEVPSRHSDVTAGEALKLLYHEVPALYLIGSPQYILPDTPFTVDCNVQLVCKYLLAYNLKDTKQRGIDRLYKEGHAPVKFSTDPDLSEDVCHALLHQHMPKHIASCKITQQLFIRYMTRRCNFLDTLPAFNYNISRGELVTKEYGVQMYTDTSKLGSTLLSIMLKEVNDFCDPTIKENWSVKPHQQLIYDFKDGGSSLGLISLHPDKLKEGDTAKFKKIGVNVPSMTEVYSRDILDSFLSRALNVELENKRLSIVDDSAYVLTLDYTIKMLNIHERHECGIPVIIEGETGVGKTALVEMLSKLWNQSLLLEWTKQKGRLIDYFHKKLGDFPLEVVPDNYQACIQAVEAISMNEATEDALLLLCNYTDGHGKLYDQVLKFLCPMRNDPVLPVLTFDDPNISSLDKLFEKAEEGKTPEITAQLLHAILKAQVKSSFYKINVHAAMTPMEIKKLFAPVVKQADLLQDTYKQVLERVASTASVRSVHRRESTGTTIRGGFVSVGSPDISLDESLTGLLNRTPFVTVFLDEVNTSSCLGLFKEIIVDRTIDGETIPSNVFIVAACNPHRGNSLASHKSAWLRGTYYVRSLHPTLKLLMWDYGSLDMHQERDYINAKMKMINKDMANPEIASLADLIVTSQKMMRDFAFRQLRDGLKTKTAQSLDVAHVSSRSCVSQRDIQRVFTFYQWFKSMYSKDDRHKDRADNHRRAMLVSLGVVYYMRLNAEFRKEYSNFLNEINRLPNEISFSRAFMEELDYFMNQVELPKGIARTLALKENLFATIVCAVTHTPLVIVGAPGSSKTLSFNQTIANLKGQESKHPFFRNTDIFRSLDPHYYQCSRRTTSNEIQTVFSRAINRQRSHLRFNLPIYCVVFMDEAGLPEESHESLKVLHYHLDKQEVSFVAITNHVLDAAKTNRAISLFRPEASDDDLETLAKGCLCSNPDEPPPEMEHALKTVVKFCQPYTNCMKNSQFSKFFGLRDFIQFINYLRRKKDESQAILSSQLVMQALERNFNGSEEFESICKTFLQAIGARLEDVSQRGILEVLQDSMQDRPQAMQDLTENEVRYKLIIDPSEDDSLVRSLFSMGLLRRENTRMFVCSDFPGDGQVQKINTIAAIRHSAIEGHTVVMSQTDDIHESFYDLFNQRFRRIDDPDHGPRYYTNIAIGAHLKPSRVHPNFQCVVVVKKSEVENTPAPFLNRFEKYLISHGSLLDMMLQKLPPCLAVMVRAAKDKVTDFISSVYNSTSLYGLQPETLDSLILDFLPPLDHTYTKLGEDSLVDTSQPPDIYLLQELLGALRNNAGFHIPRYPMIELEADAAHLFQLIQCDPKYEGLLQTMSHDVAMQAVADALNLLYNAPGPQGKGGQLDLTPEGCLVVSLLQQLLVRLLMKRVMQLMTTEAVILCRNKIPYSYLNHYLSFQAHFSLKDLISSYHVAYSATKLDLARCPNKLVVYSRSSPLVHSLPAQFVCQTRSDTRDGMGVASARDLVFQDTDKLMVQKLSSLLSQSSVQEMLRDYVCSETAEVLLLVANMQDTSIKTINHIRIMIEEAELQAPQRQNQPPKLFVLLLHFPPALFFKHCYPALFLKGWDHTYLDTVTHSSAGGVVDIQDWFQRCCFPAALREEGSGISAEPDPLVIAAKHLLPQAIPVLSAQMYFGSKKDKSFNSSMNATQRGKALERLLDYCGMGDVLCKKFCSYWKPKIMLEYLERAATFSKQRESTLNITDSIQTQFKALFLDFCVYMLTRANESYNLDVVYAEDKSSPVRTLFLDIFKQFPIPKLSQLGVLSTSLPTPKPDSRQSHFPFFSYVCDLMEKHVESSSEVANQKLDVLTERENRGLASISTADRTPDCNPQKKLEFLSSAVIALLEPMVEAPNKQVLGLVLSSMYAHFDLWRRYFSDFVSSKLNLEPPSDVVGVALPQGDIAQRLLHTYFGQLHDLDPPHRLAQLHCYIRVYQLQLAQMATLLRPLSKIKELQSVPNLLSPNSSDNLNLSAASHNSSSTEEQLVQGASQGWLLGNPVHLVNFVITTLFEALVSAVYSNQRKEQLDVWFKTYRDMMVLPTMKQYLHMYMGVAEMKYVEVKLHVMQATFLTARSCPAVNQEALVMAAQTFQTLFGRYFKENAELRPNKEHAQLGEVVELVVEVLSPNQSCQASLQMYIRPIQAALEGLLSHYFSPYQVNHHFEDIQWFLVLANRQGQWCSSPPKDMESIYEESVGVVAGGLDDDLVEKSVFQEAAHAHVPGGAMDLSRFKYHLSCILGCYKEVGTGEGDQLQSGPLLMYRQEVRTLVGRVLYPDNQLGPPGPYVPLFYQNSPPITAGKYAESKLMQQPLCHLYFLTVLEHLMAKQNSESFLHHQHSHMAGLVRMADSIHNSLQTAVGGEAVLLWVELQAVTQVLLQQLALHLDPNQTQMLGDVQQIADDVNRLLDDRELDCALSHGMVLSLHLLKLLKSSRRFTDLLTTKFHSLKIIKCLQPIHAEFQATSEIKPHLFPFLQPGAEGKLTNLYAEVSKTMNGIHSGDTEVEELVTIAQNCYVAVSDSGTDVRFSFRMVLWLVTYYEFFDKKVVSPLLCNVMGGPELAEYLREDGYIRLLQCFLNPALMVQRKEAPNALTDQQVLQLGADGRARVIHKEGQQVDPIYLLFMPEESEKLDQSDIDLRHALANLVGVVLGSPTSSNHLWYHLFAADKLENTYMTGFMYNSVIKRDGLQYDCGVELSPEGQFGRQDYKRHACRGTYTLHSLYLLLWANFGAFCMSLLTQPDADARIHGVVISEWLSLRHYCISQLKTLWLHMRNNMGLSEEQRAFYVAQALYRLRQVLVQPRNVPSAMKEDSIVPDTLRGVFETRAQLDAYEKMWHVSVYQPTWDQQSEKFIELCNQQQNLFFTYLRRLEVQYPHFPTEQEFTHSILSVGDLDQHSEGGKLCLLAKFSMEWRRLQRGGMLLPDLVEFYQWLHTNLSHLITCKRASDITIGHVIKLAKQNSSKDYGGHLWDLYKRVEHHYNTYVELIGGAIGAGACAAVRQGNKIFTIADDIPLLHFLSDIEEEGQGNDWLFVVIADIIANHNQTIENLYSSIQTHPLARLLPDEPPKVHPTEVSATTAIVGHFQEQHGVNNFLQLLRSRYQPSPSQATVMPAGSNLVSLTCRTYSTLQVKQQEPMFVMDRLEEDIVDVFIAGKPLISSENLLRTVFKFKKEADDMVGTSPDVACTAVDVHHLGERLPDDFKFPLSEPLLKRFEYEFHSASYHLMNEVVMALRTVIGHLTKALHDVQNTEHEELKDQLVPEFMLNLYEHLKGHSEVLREVGVRSAQPSHLQCLADLPLMSAYDCLKLFFGWVEEGYYDFSALPFPFKVHMIYQDRLLMDQQLRLRWLGSISDLKEELQDLITVLKHSEQDITNRVKEAASKPILDYLMEYRMLDEEEDHITRYLSRTILLQHYVAFRLALRKLLLRVHQELQGKEDGQDGSDIWLEFESDLWTKHLPHLREEIYGDGQFVFDPSTERYGFQEDEEEGEGSGGFLAALLQDAMDDKPDEDKSFKIQEPMDEPTQSYEVGHTLDLNDPSDEERSDAEDEIRPNTSVQASRGGAEGGVVGGEDDELVARLKNDPRLQQQLLSIVKKDVSSLEEAARRMSPDDVASFLVRINLSQYSEFFKESDISGELLLEADVDILKELGVESPLHQMLIMELFRRELKGGEVKYSADYMMDFLKQYRLDKYGPSLQQHGIDGDMLLDVDDKLMKSVLKEVGVTSLVDALKIKSKFKTFVSESS